MDVPTGRFTVQTDVIQTRVHKFIALGRGYRQFRGQMFASGLYRRTQHLVSKKRRQNLNRPQREAYPKAEKARLSFNLSSVSRWFPGILQASCDLWVTRRWMDRYHYSLSLLWHSMICHGQLTSKFPLQELLFSYASPRQ